MKALKSDESGEGNGEKRVRLIVPLQRFRWLGAAVIFLNVVSLGLILGSSFLAQWSNYQPVSPPTSGDSRVAIYRAASLIWAKDYHWLTGIGPGNFQEEYLAVQPHFEHYPQWAVPHAHNNWMHLWLEGGVLSGLGFGLLGASIFGALRCCRLRFSFTVPLSTAHSDTRPRLESHSKMKALLESEKLKREFQRKERGDLGFKKAVLAGGGEAGALAALIVSYFLLHGLVDATIWQNDTAVIFWVLAIGSSLL